MRRTGRLGLALLTLCLLSPSLSFAGQTARQGFQTDQCITVEEEDGSPSDASCKKVKVTNGTLTNNGDGTYSLSTGAGGGGAPTTAEYVTTESNGSLSAEVAPSAADQVPNSTSSTAGVWTTTPTLHELTLHEDSTEGTANIGQIVSNEGPTHSFATIGGTLASPLKTVDDEVLGQIIFESYDGSSFHTAAKLKVTSVGTPSSSNSPGFIDFYTTAAGSTIPTLRGTISSAGNWTLGASETDYGERLAIEGDVLQKDTSPHYEFWDSSGTTAYLFHADTAATPAYAIFALWKGTESGSGFSVSPDTPLWGYDASNNFYLPQLTTKGFATVGANGQIGSAPMTRCAGVLALVSTNDNIPMGSFPVATTITSAWCHCHTNCGTPATITLEDGNSNAMTLASTLTCTVATSNPTPVAITSGGGLNAYEPFQFDTTNSPTASGDYSVCVSYTQP